MNELPIEIECFLIKYGFLEAKKQNDPQPTGWIPTYKGEQPPF